ncbi:L-type lectin-domain containing receptor kinase IX.1-like [Tripterygium wilfordii]|uniref:L-type lectin-domain containing receptor kinase IX.1-like n=1 Tax=Tripterygium wilfordii TaxID=458696 RepID=UPI0018F7E5CD|nr:L-type lectin-domain containing receptor kinase IX.1-like [Tripterygium wilfordii]
MVVVIFFFLLVFLPPTTSLSFNYSSFEPDTYEIRCEGNATIVDSVIQLTPNQGQTTGHATHVEPMHLWDKASGSLADFTTHFTFSINALNNDKHGDGLALFIAPLTYHMPAMIGDGAGIGLASADKKINSSDNPFVAVEFDTFHNLWDQENDHVGIDINSLRSSRSVTWYSSPMDGKLMEARVTYNGTAKNLGVLFTGIIDNVTIQQELYYDADLRDYLPEWVSVGFSAATGADSEFHTIHSWNLSSNLQIDTTSPSPVLPIIPPKSDKWLIAKIVSAVLFTVFVALVFLCIWKKRKTKNKDQKSLTDRSMDYDFEKGIGAKKMAYSELVVATNNFTEELGRGGFGAVYKGYLRDMDSYIAVKRVSKDSNQGVKEYASEVKIISQLRHRNLVKLIGWCHENGELLLVYEFIPNGTLESHLFDEQHFLPWEKRYKISIDTASAIQYLHEQCEPCVLHRDIKSSNIMLDLNLEAKLGDFGLARLVDRKKGSKTTAWAGTFGYLDPECVTTGKARKESDIFSLGVLALEIACARKPIEQQADGRWVHMVEWLWEFYQNRRILDAADSKLQGNFDAQQMERLMIVGLWCAHPNSASRPSIAKALAFLNFDAQLPTLPLTMPQLQSPPPRSILSVIFSYVTATFGRGQSRNTDHDQSTQFATSSASLVPNAS